MQQPGIPAQGTGAGRCLGTDKCTRCFKACPNGALSRREDGFVAIDRSKCVGCKDMPCAEACPAQGIIVYGKPYTVAEALKVATMASGRTGLVCAGGSTVDAETFRRRAPVAERICSQPAAPGP